MKKIETTFFAVILILFTLWTLNACKKDKNDDVTDPAVNTDKELYDLARANSGFTWYKHSDTLLPKSSGSGHFHSFLRTRYNSIAATMLDTAGKVLPGAVFPEGSLIVKELFGNATTFSRYAILYKQSNHADADGRGWVWGYIEANGTVAEPASKKGSPCNSCHAQSGSIDYMLMNKYFP